MKQRKQQVCTTCNNFASMYVNQGSGSVYDPLECKMNLGGPSEQTCLKRQAGYTTKSGIIRNMSLAHMAMSKSSGTKLLIDTDTVAVTPSVFANNGTALKPSIEFDPRQKKNIGLTIDADISFVERNPKPSPDFLNYNIVSEILVSSVTTLDNSTSLPCAVDYVNKEGKSGEEMKNLFFNHCKVLQVCQSCQKVSPTTENVIGEEAVHLCNSTCEACSEEEKVCNKCRADEQVSYLPCLRACDRCLQTNQKRNRRVFVALTTDCEEGNKQAMLSIKQALEDDSIGKELSLLVLLPDCPHVGKSLKGSF